MYDYSEPSFLPMPTIMISIWAEYHMLIYIDVAI